MKPLFHSLTQKNLQHIKSNLPQSLLISGEDGVGLLTAAKWLASPAGAHVISPLDTKGAISPSGTISIEVIRNLYEQTRAKRTSRHVIIIDNAERMSRGAQTAFLKLLEEPQAQTHFILTSHTPEALLPTIRSRVEHTVLRPLTNEQTITFIDSLGITDATQKTQLQFIASGLPAELYRLVHNSDYFKARAATVTAARDFIKGTPYQKLQLMWDYKADRDQALLLLEQSIRILRRSLSSKPQPGIILQLELLVEIYQKITNNHNISLQLARFVMI